VARIKAGLEAEVYMGNLDAVRDWGYAPEYVEAMWLTLQHDSPSDYVVATGDAYSVRDFVRFSFEHAGLDWEEHVRFDERYLRPTEVDSLIGDSTRARQALGWEPKVRTPELARIMVDADIAALETEGATWVHRAWAHG
jgi:GDPmannose 4,6-dehydratase